MKRILAACLAWLALCAPLAAQDRVPVYVSYAGQDSVGTRLKYQINQALARSSTLREVYIEDSAILILELVTIANSENSHYQTIYSTTYLLNNDEGLPYHLYGEVGYCGSDLLAGCAEDVVVRLDSQRELLLRAIAEMDDAASADDVRSDFW